MSIRAITFDFWQTLFRDARGEPRKRLRHEALAREAGVSMERAAEALDDAVQEFLRSHIEDQRTLAPEDAVRLVAAFLDVDFSPEVREELAHVFGTAIIHHPPEPIEGALDAVRAAAARRPVGLICDSGLSPGSSLRVLMDRHGFTEYFKVLTFSDEVGVSKPQAPMFERTAEALGVAAHEMLHIGDLEPTDIAGIQACGGLAALFTGANPRFHNDTNAEHTFANWAEFLDRLPQLID